MPSRRRAAAAVCGFSAATEPLISRDTCTRLPRKCLSKRRGRGRRVHACRGLRSNRFSPQISQGVSFAFKEEPGFRGSPAHLRCAPFVARDRLAIVSSCFSFEQEPSKSLSASCNTTRIYGANGTCQRQKCLCGLGTLVHGSSIRDVLYVSVLDQTPTSTQNRLPDRCSGRSFS